MQIETDDLKTIRVAEYDPETDMFRLVIICTSSDLDTDVLRLDVAALLDRTYKASRKVAIGDIQPRAAL